MQWRCADPLLENGEKILHLRYDENDPWLPYTAAKWRTIARPDHRVPKGSRGYATMQLLLGRGVELLPSPPHE